MRYYLHSDAFRIFLSQEASRKIGAAGEFAPFQWQGLAVDTESFSAKGNGRIRELRADGLHTEIGLGSVSRGIWEIRGTNVRQLSVAIDTTAAQLKKPITSKLPPKAKSSKSFSWLPQRAELQEIDIQNVAFEVATKKGRASASGMHFHATQDGTKNAYKIQIEGGQFRLPFSKSPEVRLDRLRARYQENELFLSEANLAIFENGLLNLTGEANFNSQRFSIDGNATGIQCEDLLDPDWSKRFGGEIASTFNVANFSGPTEAHGKLSVANGTVTALPLLDVLAAYADTRRFRVLNLHEARADWRWIDGEVNLNSVVLASDGLARLEGSLVIRGQEIAGKFRLGIAPGTLATIPGAETDVFILGERGMLWAPLTVSGTLKDPEEDLTERLIAAAGLRLLEKLPESSDRVIQYAQDALRDHPSKTVEKGLKILSEGGKSIRDVNDLLDGILGGEKPHEVDPVPAPD